MAELTAASRVRAAERAAITKKINALNAELTKTPVNREILEIGKNLLEKKSILLRDHDEKIMEILNSGNGDKIVENIQKEVDEKTVYEEKIEQCIYKIKVFCKNEENINKSEKELSTSFHRELSEKKLNVKLPKLTLRKYNGDPVEFHAWMQSFKSAIDENDNLHDVDKFVYLKTLLGDKAAQSIRGMTLTGENYRAALDILENRYGNQQAIINAHMESLINIPIIRSSKDTAGLRKMYDLIEGNLRSLENLGITNASYGSLLIPIFLSRLPEEIRLLISRKFDSTNNWDLKDLLKTLDMEIKARERSEITPTIDHQVPSVATLNTIGGSGACIFCSKNHQSSACRIVTNPDARYATLKQKGYCFNCIKLGHPAFKCNSPARCKICSRKHHTSIHGYREGVPRGPILPQGGSNGPKDGTFDRVSQKSRGGDRNLDKDRAKERLPDTERNRERQSRKQTKERQSDNIDNIDRARYIDTEREGERRAAIEQVVNHTMHVFSKQETLLQTADAEVSSTVTDRFITMRIILDNASNRTYITQEAKKKLGLKSIGKEAINISVFGQNEAKHTECDIVQIKIQCRGSNTDAIYVTATVVPKICDNISYERIKWHALDYDCFKELPFADKSITGKYNNNNQSIDILIGADYYWSFIEDHIIRTKKGPVAIKSKLGYVISGPININKKVNTATLFIQSDNSEINEKLEYFWSLEGFLGEEKPDTLEKFNKSIKYDGERYSVSLPFKGSEQRTLPDNYDHAKKRLISLLKRLKVQPDLMDTYETILKEQELKGIISEVTSSVPNIGTTYYMPHHCVVRPDKASTKVRIVYDASAKGSGKSLNQLLHQGPNLLSNIFNILVRFRCHKIAYTADIEKAFLQVNVDEADRDYLRFLWVDDPKKDEPILKIYRYNRVVFGLKSSPFLLNATIQHHVRKCENVELVNEILNSIYVDDICGGASSISNAHFRYTNTKELMKTASLNLRKLESNSNELLKMIDDKSQKAVDLKGFKEDQSTYSKLTTNANASFSEKESKVLGLIWDKEKDEFLLRLNGLDGSVPKGGHTKRSLLSIISSIYDPLGLISPIVIKLKILFQQICTEKLGWDDPVSLSLIDTWKMWLKDVESIPEFRFKRCYLSETGQNTIQIHTFWDASAKAFAAAVYLRVQNSNGVCCNLVASKSRIAPRKKITIPRMELLAALLAARLWSVVKHTLDTTELSIGESFFWGDSTVALCWIKNADLDKYKQFVQNRIVEIRSIAGREHWNHVPGVENPSDLPSRGVNAGELDNKWKHGPKWLIEQPDRWPLPISPLDTEESMKEVKRSVKGLKGCIVLSTMSHAESFNLEAIIDPTEFSSFARLKRITAYVYRFINNLKFPKQPLEGRLRADEVAKAEAKWVYTMQMRLTKDKNFCKLEAKLRIYEDSEGFLRSKGRIDNAQFEREVSNPLVLPKDHYLVTLIVIQAHRLVFHNGVNQTMSEIRKRFWIPCLRQICRKIIHKCVICKKLEGKPFRRREMPQLPDFRVRASTPFAYCAIDFAGPIYVKMSLGKRSPSTKCYIALITCAYSRAIHLELTMDLSAASLIRCLRRFIARRGAPKLMISDNAASFKSEDVQDFLVDRNINWKFSTPKSPWENGIIERLVRSTKRCLKKRLGRAMLNYEEIDTVIREIENTINNRPLTYIDTDTIQEAVTPNHLSYGRRLDLVTVGTDLAEPNMDTQDITRRVIYRQHLVANFVDRWRKEYLISLRQSLGDPAKQGEPVSVGDVVLIHDEGNRLMWRLGKVLELKKSADGEVRGVILKVGDRDKKTHKT